MKVYWHLVAFYVLVAFSSFCVYKATHNFWAAGAVITASVAVYILLIGSVSALSIRITRRGP